MADQDVDAGRDRPRPSFLVVGAAKSGTTTLHDHLRAHPQIDVPRQKEPSFFAGEALRRHPDRNHGDVPPRMWIETWDQYLDLFDGRRNGVRARGEVSPAYLSTNGAAEVVAERLPGVRAVALLRDPADRAFSHWLMRRKVGDYDPSFGRELDRQLPLLAEGAKSFLWQGCYATQLEPYLRLLGGDRLLVLRFEDFVADAPTTMARVYDFIGVDAAPPEDDERRRASNRSGVPRGRAAVAVLAVQRRLAHRYPTNKIPAGLMRFNARLLTSRATLPRLGDRDRARLREAYRDEVERLERMFGIDTSPWQQ